MRARGFIENRRLHKALGLKRPGSLRKTINKFNAWSQTFVGDIVIGVVICLAGLVLAYWLSWVLWTTGYWG